MTPLASKSPSPNLAIIYISLAPLPTNPVLPDDYQDSKNFFKSLFRPPPYTLHKFHEFNTSWKQTTQPIPTCLNIDTSAKRRTANTTLRLAWSHPHLYPTHQARHCPTTRTLPHKSVLTIKPHRQSSIYVPSIIHKDLDHIPDPSKCCPADLSICPTSCPPNLWFLSRFHTWRPQRSQQCPQGQHKPLSPPTWTLMLSSFAPSRMDSSQPSPTARLIWWSNFDDLPTKSKDYKITSSNTRKHLNGPLRAIHSTIVVSPTSASPAATGFLAQLSGSSSTTMVLHWASRTLTDPNPCRTLSTYTPSPTINMMKKAKQNPHSLYQHGSAFSWWAHPSILPCSIIPLLTIMTGGSPMRFTTTATSTANSLTPASSLSRCRSTSMPSNRLVPLVNLNFYSCGPLNKSKNSRTYHASPRLCAGHGSISLVDVVIQSSSGVMLLALRSPAHSNLPCLM